MDFYSARLLFIILIKESKPKKTNDYDDSVIVFRARDFEHAFERALEIGSAREHQYKNIYGQTVRWVLVEIVNLDWIGRTINGKEVASKLHSRTSKEPIPPKKRFHPKKSRPESSF